MYGIGMTGATPEALATVGGLFAFAAAAMVIACGIAAARPAAKAPAAIALLRGEGR